MYLSVLLDRFTKDINVTIENGQFVLDPVIHPKHMSPCPMMRASVG